VIEVTKTVEFDAGHRVPNHDSKCKNPHGHRYKVEATIVGDLVLEAGHPQEGMVLDFGFIKELLTTEIHDVLDHGFIVHGRDQAMLSALGLLDVHDHPKANLHGWKVIVLPYVPTAENLAYWCYKQIVDGVEERSSGRAQLRSIRVWETPTCSALCEWPG
jgi:6-pyruvoyltetrahydropterin/6-carboxytetrahydropterin synthase